MIKCNASRVVLISVSTTSFPSEANQKSADPRLQITDEVHTVVQSVPGRACGCGIAKKIREE